MPPFLADLSFLDVGTNAGFYPIQLKLRGASTVVGIESEEIFFQQALMCKEIWGVDVEYQKLDAHEIGKLNQSFDVVLFLAILYHLRNPLFVLEEISKICRDAILVESEIIPEHPDNGVYVRGSLTDKSEFRKCTKGLMKFVEDDDVNRDNTNWWIPDTECILGMLRTAGFRNISRPYYLKKNRVFIIASKSTDSVLNLAQFK